MVNMIKGSFGARVPDAPSTCVTVMFTVVDSYSLFCLVPLLVCGGESESFHLC